MHFVKNNIFTKSILNCNELIERNVLVVNKENNDNILVLSYVLSKLSNEDNLFNDKLTVMCYNEDKTYYKKLLIDNPKISFINLNFVNDKYKNKRTKKKQIVIVDFDYIDDINKIEELFDDNIYLIVTSTNYASYTGDLMNVMRKYKSTLCLNKKDELKILQKRLFKKVISSNLDELVDMNDYINFINNKKIEITNIIIKSGELKYN